MLLNAIVVVVVVVQRADSGEAAEMVGVALGHERIFQTRLARSPFVLNCYSVKGPFNVIQSETTSVYIIIWEKVRSIEFLPQSRSSVIARSVYYIMNSFDNKGDKVRPY